MITAIDTLISEAIEPGGPGFAVAIAQNGATIHAQGYGLANLEWQNTITPKTVFRLASITKPFTATAIMLLEQAGKLRIDDPITAYLPDYPMHGETITLRHLLTHTSGITNLNDLDNFEETWSRAEPTPQEICAIFAHLPLDFKPGAQFTYSNSGYELLGLLIETISGISYETFVRENICAPLGMNHTYYMRPEIIIPERATGYTRTENGYQHTPFRCIEISFASGGLGSNVEDLLLWDHSMRTNRLLTPETLQRALTPPTLTSGEASPYGFGWFVERQLGQRVAYHEGNVEGFSTLMVRFLDLPLTLVLLANQAWYDVTSLGLKIGETLLSTL